MMKRISLGDEPLRNCGSSCSWLLSIILIMCLGSIANASPRILVLHSHNPGYQWTRSINAAFTEGLHEQLEEVEIFIEYLDARRIDFTKTREPFVSFLNTKYASTPDLIVAVDNDALDFVREFQPTFVADAPIVFAGVNRFQKSLIDGLPGVAGIPLRNNDPLAEVDSDGACCGRRRLRLWDR